VFLTQLSSVVKGVSISLEEGMQGSDSDCSTSSILSWGDDPITL